MKQQYRFDDNIRVKDTKESSEYFSIHFREPDEVLPCPVALTRYCLPGRLDIYCFDLLRGGFGDGERIRYFTDVKTTMPEALKLLTRDLNKPKVVTLIMDACKAKGHHLTYARHLSKGLLQILAPQSEAARVLKNWIDTELKERLKRANASVNSDQAKI